MPEHSGVKQKGEHFISFLKILKDDRMNLKLCNTLHPNAYMLSPTCRFPQCHTFMHNCAWSCAWTLTHTDAHTYTHMHMLTHTYTPTLPLGSLPCGLIVSRLKGLKPLGFNHDEMMFAPASQGKAAWLHRVICSADLADLDGWLIGGWSEAVYNKGLDVF